MFRLPCMLLLLCLLVSSGAFAAQKVSHKISELDFKDISVGDALRILSKQSDLNIISSKEAAKIEMTMFLRDIEPMEVLEAMAKTYNLWYQEDKKSKVIRIYTVKEFRLGKVDYHNERTEIFTFKHQRTSLDFAYMIQDLFGFQRVMLSQGADESQVTNDLYDRMRRFDIIASKTTFSGSSGSGSSRGGSGNNQNGNSQGGNNQNGGGSSRNGSNSSRNNNQNGNRQNNNLTGTRNNQGGNQSNSMVLGRNQAFDISKMLPEGEIGAMLSGAHNLSAGAMDVLIEHISPIYVTLIRRQNRVLVRTRDKDAMQEIQRLFQQLNIEMATLLLEVKVLQLDLNDGYESSFEFDVKSGNYQLARGSDSFVSSAADISELVRAGLGDPSMVAAVVSKNFDARLKLLENEGRVTALATPMLTTTNQEVSRIFIGEERPITTEIICGSGNTANAEGTSTIVSNCILEATTNIRSIGKTLLLTPNINANGTVDIRILVEDSSICPLCGKIPSSNGVGELVNNDVDTVLTQTFSGDIIANNGQMVAVGGLINEKSKDIEKKVPVLGDIPYLGFFFSDTEKVRERTELVILIRPYVMNNHEDDIDINHSWLEANSIHPSADKLNHLDIYKNSEHLDKGYALQSEYGMYSGQDAFDHYHEKGAGAQPPKVSESSPASAQQAAYMQLTEYAAKSIHLPASSYETVSAIQSVALSASQQSVELFHEEALSATAVASWRKENLYVTVFEVRNHSDAAVNVEHQHLKGDWLATTIEEAQLAAKSSSGDMTYLYLISEMPFEQALK